MAYFVDVQELFCDRFIKLEQIHGADFEALAEDVIDNFPYIPILEQMWSQNCASAVGKSRGRAEVGLGSEEKVQLSGGTLNLKFREFGY